MTVRLNSGDADFQQALDALLTRKRDSDTDIRASVAAILSEVQARGDAALADYSRRFDRLDLATVGLRVSADAIDEAKSRVAPKTLEALSLAADRIRAFHRQQRTPDRDYTDESGVRLGERWTPVAAAGLYVPGGLASYPSSVLMNALPAKVAGVERLVMTVPSPDGLLSPLVLAAAELAGVDEIYRVGGAQAVAALAYGTETISPVDKIVGPGNAWVAEAKRQVFGCVGIDTIAGPSEILVVADAGSNPAWVAADLLSQAEHDRSAQSVLISDSADFADRVEAEIAIQLETLPKADIARDSWQNHGVIIITDSLQAAVPVIDRIAPEHLELCVEDPEPLMQAVRHAGAIFLGRYTPEAIGDYVAGTNHVLPTSRAARFSSGLSVYDFMKRTTFTGCTPESLALIGPAAIILAEEEGLAAHARSVSVRLDS